MKQIKDIKEYKREYYQKNKERLNKLHKEWKINNPEKMSEYQKKYENKEEVKPKRKIYKQKWQENNRDKIKGYRQKENYKELNRKLKIEERKKFPEKIKARDIANQKIEITIYKLCERCNIEFAKERHHNNYSKPLDVELLCRKCHKIADKEINMLEVCSN